MAALTREEKERILRALEEDRELRYALMGLLGFREVLERVAGLEERQLRLEERFARLEERFAQLEKRFADLEERFLRLEERAQKLGERFAELERRFLELAERQQKLEERFARLEEGFAELAERQQRLEERLERLERTLATVAHRFGVMSESAFREAVKGILERYFGATASRWSCYDGEGLVYGYPSTVEVDVVVKDGVHVLVEVESRVDPGDVLELARIGRLYEKVTGVRPRLAIVGGFVSPRAREVAARLGVDVYSYLEERARES